MAEEPIEGTAEEVEDERQETLEEAAEAAVSAPAEDVPASAGVAVDSPPSESPDDYRPSGAELVVADPGDETSVFVALDKRDERMIMDELQGRLLKTMLYDFPQGGNRVVDLSVRGVLECISLMNRTGKCSIRVALEAGVEWDRERIDTDWQGDVPHISATVYAVDDKTGQGTYGTASQPLLMKLTDSTLKRRKRDKKHAPDDGVVSDPFARQKALNKAQRNALRTFIPEGLRQVLIAQYRKDDEAVLHIRAGQAGAAAELPPPLTDERAEKLRDEARGLFLEVQQVSRTAYLLPGAFDAQMSRAEWDHTRLEEFVGRVRGLRDRALADKAKREEKG